MALFCSILFLAYLDMGCFASNGVNGSLEPRMGIQVSRPQQLQQTTIIVHLDIKKM